VSSSSIHRLFEGSHVIHAGTAAKSATNEPKPGNPRKHLGSKTIGTSTRLSTSHTSPAMDRPSDSQTPSASSQLPKPIKEVPPSYRSLYLILYNFISAILWAAVMGRVVTIAGIHGWRYVFTGTDSFVRMVQTGAALEVVHSIVGMFDSSRTFGRRRRRSICSIREAKY
jgi:hypothetical protein